MSNKSGNSRDLTIGYRPLSIFDVWNSVSGELCDSWRPFDFGEIFVHGTEMFEEKGQLVMKTKLPGINKKDLDIELEGDRLTIKAEKKGKTDKESSGHNGETYFEHYFHTVTLPYPVKEDKITAKFYKGILELRLPKGEENKPKKIEVKAQLPKIETRKREKIPQHKTS